MKKVITKVDPIPVANNSWLDRFRNCLKKNKIFFEVIVASLLSFMAVFISIQSNKIAQSQALIMEQEGIPHLDILFTQEFNDSTKIYDNDVFLVYNRGGKLSNFKMETISYLYFRRNHPVSSDTIKIPITGYINFEGTISGDGDGLIYRIDTRHNGSKEKQLRDSLLNIGYFDIATYAKISYTDIFDKKHFDFYKIGFSGYKINQAEWQKIETAYNDAMLEEGFFFPQLSASHLKKIVEKAAK